MFAFIITLVVFLPVAILPLALETRFSSHELSDMGVCLENLQEVQSPPIAHDRPLNSSHTAHTCRFSSLSV